jgi:hypothetical protein
MHLTARQSEITARYLLAHLQEIPVFLKERRWAELAALAEFASRDASPELAQTDPALYRLLRQQITELRIRGWSCLDVKALRKLANKKNGREN